MRRIIEAKGDGFGVMNTENGLWLNGKTYPKGTVFRVSEGSLTVEASRTRFFVEPVTLNGITAYARIGVGGDGFVSVTWQGTVDGFDYATADPFLRGKHRSDLPVTRPAATPPEGSAAAA